MENQVQPEEIAFVSFTRKAAREALGRILEQFRLKEDDFPYVRTLHSLAYRELAIINTEMMRKDNYIELGETLGLEFSKTDSMEDEDGFIENVKMEGDKYAYLDSFARSRGITPEQTWELLGDYNLSWLEYERYSRAVTQYKKERGLLDFCDLLTYPHTPLDVKVAIIDEAQDLSTLQWYFALGIFSKVERMYVAGDDDQAIYTWSGADVTKFLELPGERVVLDHSYRIPKAIHDVAEDISSRIFSRVPKEYGHNGELGLVDYHTSIEHVDMSQGTWLVLVRNGYMMKQVIYSLRESGYLYACRGSSVINRKHVVAIAAWEKWRRTGELEPEEIPIIEMYLPKGTEEWPDKIWHEALTTIPIREREYYISLLRRGEKITKAPRINVSTIHGVKGGEADHVCLLTDITQRTHEGFLVNPDNEWRVWYVAATRAKQSLHIVMPRTGYYISI